MSALSNLTQTTETDATTLPSWFDQAQQNVVNQAGTALSNAPQLSQTTAQGAINTLQGPNNPFTQAQNTLGSISSGAANPWMTDSSGNVTPNTNTAMGGLFAAQNQQLKQLLPTYQAPTEGSNIASGNFGSLRGQTAMDTAAANAFANLNAAQMQAALQNQQTGVTAAANQGNVAQQGIQNAMQVGQTQMAAPFTNAANYGNILAGLNVPGTQTTTSAPSVLNQISAAGTSLQGLGTGANNLLKNLGVSGGLSSLGTGIKNLFSDIGSPALGTNAGVEQNSDPTSPDFGKNEITAPDGQVYTQNDNGEFVNADNEVYNMPG